jgi:hypothetical protein
MPANSEMPNEPEPTVIASTDHETIPQCLSNPTLGAAAHGVFLDVMEAQVTENRRAEIENRPARIAKRDARYPGWEKPEDAPSHWEDVGFGNEYADGEKVIAPQSGPLVPPMTKRPRTPAKGSHGVAERSKGGSGVTSQKGGSGSQKGSEAPSRTSGE